MFAKGGNLGDFRRVGTAHLDRAGLVGGAHPTGSPESSLRCREPLALEIWNRLLVLSIGGALGVNARYWLGVLITRWSGPRFPWATVVINVTGSFAIGFLAVILAYRWPHPLGRLFVVTGFLGGYTTFSSFTFESLKLWEDGEKGLSMANTFGSVAAGLAAVTLGVALGRAVIGSPPESERLVHSHRVHVEPSEAAELPPESFLDGEVEEG
jgi:fluoride exporter